jgi:hypothetical protein
MVLNPSALRGLFEEGGVAEAALHTKAELVATRAKELVNVGTGRLRASIHVVDGVDETGVVCLVGSDVDYAIYQELEPGDPYPEGGTRERPGGKPFLRPALFGPTP